MPDPQAEAFKVCKYIQSWGAALVIPAGLQTSPPLSFPFLFSFTRSSHSTVIAESCNNTKDLPYVYIVDPILFHLSCYLFRKKKKSLLFLLIFMHSWPQLQLLSSTYYMDIIDQPQFCCLSLSLLQFHFVLPKIMMDKEPLLYMFCIFVYVVQIICNSNPLKILSIFIRMMYLVDISPR